MLLLNRLFFRLDVYHHSQRLLIQFILVEFIRAYQKICEIKRIVSSCEDFFSNPVFDEKGNHFLNTIASTMIELLGEEGQTIMLPWHCSDGALFHLNNYCESFVQSGDGKNKESEELHRKIKKLRKLSLQGISLIKEMQSGSEALVYLDKQKALFLTVETMVRVMRRFSTLIARVLLRFHDDENVMFCVLRNKESLNNLCGSNFIGHLLRQAYPNGLEEACHFLVSRYSMRGFDEIGLEIKARMNEL